VAEFAAFGNAESARRLFCKYRSRLACTGQRCFICGVLLHSIDCLDGFHSLSLGVILSAHAWFCVSHYKYYCYCFRSSRRGLTMVHSALNDCRTNLHNRFRGFTQRSRSNNGTSGANFFHRSSFDQRIFERLLGTFAFWRLFNVSILREGSSRVPMRATSVDHLRANRTDFKSLSAELTC
jgi:hypothetical protein